MSIKKFVIGTCIIYGGFQLIADPTHGVCILPDPDRLKDLQTFEVVEDRQQVQSLLGLINSLKVWSPSFSVKTKALRELVKSSTAFSWSTEAQAELDTLKR